MEECPHRMCESKCVKEEAGCKNGKFPLNTTGSYAVARLYLDTKYISLTLAELQYLSRMFHVIHKKLREYIHSFLDVLSYVSAALTSVGCIESAPNASKHIMYTHVFEELATAV